MAQAVTSVVILGVIIGDNNYEKTRNNHKRY